MLETIVALLFVGVVAALLWNWRLSRKIGETNRRQFSDSCCIENLQERLSEAEAILNTEKIIAGDDDFYDQDEEADEIEREYYDEEQADPNLTCCRCDGKFRNEGVLEMHDGYVHYECMTDDECEERGLLSPQRVCDRCNKAFGEDKRWFRGKYYHWGCMSQAEIDEYTKEVPF